MNTENSHPSFSFAIPPGEDRERSVCTRCGFVDYQNPKVVVGSVVTDHQGRLLLCRRAIEPQSGLWTLPAGYLELGETTEEGARREAHEEAGADIVLDQLLAVYSIPAISQVQLIYRGRLNNADSIAAGPESAELMLAAYDDIPWTELAFPSVAWALRDWAWAKDKTSFSPRANPLHGL